MQPYSLVWIATNTIMENDTAIVSIANTTDGAEPSTNGVMTVTQTAISVSDTVVLYSVAGTATAGVDYTALSGSVTIPAGDTTAQIDIAVIDDTIVESGETVVITLTSIDSGLGVLDTGAALTATNTLGDDDAALNAIVAAAFERQAHNYVSRRMSFMSQHSPTLHAYRSGCGEGDETTRLGLDVAGNGTQTTGTFSFAHERSSSSVTSSPPLRRATTTAAAVPMVTR